MYIMTLEVNQKCNLKCKYCYLGEKDGSKMSYDTACMAIDIAFQKVEYHKDKSIWFDFVGGEALLDFDMIRKMIVYIEEKNKIEQNILRFSMTTNATLLNQEIIRYFVEKNFTLKVSIDGEKAINDLNRLSKAGYSVHDKIVSNLFFLREFEKLSNKIVQVTNVVTNNNYTYYADSVKYLTEELGFKLIDTGIDYYNDWTEKEKKGLEIEFRKVFDYFIQRAMQRKGFRWSFVESMIDIQKKSQKRKFYSCGAGIVSVYVRCDGTFFACPGNLDKKVKLGDIYSGFDKEKIQWLKCFEDINNDKCHRCVAYEVCVEKSCVMMNIAKTGNPHEPDPMLCWTRLLMYSIYNENKRLISRIKI